MQWYAHSADDKNWQFLKDHSVEVACLASLSAKKFNAEILAYIIGILHDTGKYTESFQNRLYGANQRMDHAIIGAKILEEYAKENPKYAFLYTLLQYTIAGHHAGLPDKGYIANDVGTLCGRLAKPMPDYSAWKDEITVENIKNLQDFFKIPQCPHKILNFTLSFWTRMLYSCLVDADFMNTEAFCDEKKAKYRRKSSFNYAYNDILTTYIQEKTKNCKDSAINTARNKIFSFCKQAGLGKQGAYSLTVPTGGGKTFSSMAFALEHAKKHHLDRIIYVIPYTSIIEQTASVFKNAFGEDSVLEHHCNYIIEGDSSDETTLSFKLATENWEHEIILTTAVQFFESLFANKSSKCRKLHNIVNSIVVIDEAQMIPLHVLSPSILAMRELIANYKTSFLFCTATQPALNTLIKKDSGKKLLQYGFHKNEIKEVIPQDYLKEVFEIFKRTGIEDKGTLSLDAIHTLLKEHEQCLCIVNTRAQAQKLFQTFTNTEHVFHLSTYMFPMHRKHVLSTIKKRLKDKEPCIVISTSLIECGVDISFPHVMRAYTGLDSIAQAAGRCNREGELEQGKVTLFDFEQEIASKDSSLQRRISVTKDIYKKYKNELFSPQAIEEYFYHLYSLEEIDTSIIIHDMKENLPADLNFKTISENFSFINSSQVTIIIDPQNINLDNHCSDTFEENVKLLSFTGMNRTLRQYFQQYSVQVYAHELQKLHENGIVYKESNLKEIGLYFASMGYDEKMGLCATDDYMLSPESFIL